MKTVTDRVLITCPECGHMIHGRLWRCPDCCISASESYRAESRPLRRLSDEGLVAALRARIWRE